MTVAIILGQRICAIDTALITAMGSLEAASAALGEAGFSLVVATEQKMWGPHLTLCPNHK